MIGDRGRLPFKNKDSYKRSTLESEFSKGRFIHRLRTKVELKREGIRFRKEPDDDDDEEEDEDDENDDDEDDDDEDDNDDEDDDDENEDNEDKDDDMMRRMRIRVERFLAS
ncbi:hypothetical protein AWC38_SpisGene23231 [Stylophora pistillata]|uniref:Uncharacterized protein n=1 Tax=Stylophora pistillata TaxID=50429 RepID=A0A2B4R8D7_STYPI|nr:hypothetical protein AWC38_SpisGene23231 [Stylophora pistillata]